MVLSPSRESDSCSATQKLPSYLSNPILRYRTHKNLPLVPILSQINPLHSISPRYILILSAHLRLFSPFMLHALPISASCTWRRVQVVTLLVMQLSPPSRHFIPLRSKYSPQHPVLKHPKSVFLPQCYKVSHPYRTTGKIQSCVF
jgi:hypothetical protein